MEIVFQKKEWVTLKDITPENEKLLLKVSPELFCLLATHALGPPINSATSFVNQSIFASNQKMDYNKQLSLISILKE